MTKTFGDLRTNSCQILPVQGSIRQLLDIVLDLERQQVPQRHVVCTFACVQLHMIRDSIRVPQREDQVGKLVLLEFGDKPLVLIVGKLARVVFKDGLGRLATGRVEQHDRGDIVPVGLGDAGDLLGQDPHGDAVVPRREAEIDQLPRAALDIFRRGAVVEHEQGVGPREEFAGQPQPVFDLVLQAGNNKDVRVAVHEALVCLVFDKGGAEEHDVVKLAPEWAPQLVEKILRLA